MIHSIDLCKMCTNISASTTSHITGSLYLEISLRLSLPLHNHDMRQPARHNWELSANSGITCPPPSNSRLWVQDTKMHQDENLLLSSIQSTTSRANFYDVFPCYKTQRLMTKTFTERSPVTTSRHQIHINNGLWKRQCRRK